MNDTSTPHVVEPAPTHDTAAPCVDPAATHDSSVPRVDPALLHGNRQPLAGYRATHFGWDVADGVATLTLDRPERKNPLTFDSYAELRDLFGRLKYAYDVHAVVLIGAGADAVDGRDDRLRAGAHRLDQVAGHAGEHQ